MTEHMAGFVREQGILFPDTFDEYVSEENPVRFIDAFVDSLDLKGLGFKRVEPNEIGRPSYDPCDMLKLFVYGYLNQVRSSRKLERECHRNVEVIWLMKKLTPDFKTISRFREGNIECIKPVFKEFVYLCKSLDLFGTELLGIDGSKFRAVNSKQRNFNEAKLADALKRLEEKIAMYLKEVEENDLRNGSDDGQRSGAEKLEEKLAKLEEKRQEYIRAQDLMRETGQKEVSLTDTESRLMRNNGKLEVCYNAEAAVDSKNKLVAEYEVVNSSADQNQLSPLVKGAKENLGVERIDATADKGFHTFEEIKECVDNGITPYVPEPDFGASGIVRRGGVPTPEFYENRFVYDRASDTYICPAGQRLEFFYWSKNHDGKGKRYALYRTDSCSSCPYYMTKCTKNKRGRLIRRWEHEDVIDEMNARLKSTDGKWIAGMRKELCEHPFGTMKRTFNQGYFLLRGLRKVRGEMGFTMLAYNLRRAINILGVKALLAYLAR